MSPKTPIRAASWLLGLWLLVAASAAIEAQSPLAPLPEKEWTVDAAKHLLLRAGFGGTEAEIKALHARGLKGAVDWLVDYESAPSEEGFSGTFPERLRGPDFLTLTREERMAKQRTFRRANGKVMLELRHWWVTRMVTTQRPLEEKMTLFWHGHFTSGYRDVRNALHMCQQNDLLREHATGNFAVFVQDVAKDAAMLEYLDNNRNRRGQANENFAREVLELFTLGLGNYTEHDIKEAARAFTGWTFNQSGGFVFNQRQHDFGMKEFMGKKGRFNGDDIINIVLEKPQVATYISAKLMHYFLGDTPSPEVVAPFAELLRSPTAEGAKSYDLKPFLKTLFASRAFYDESVRGMRIKGPIELVVGAARQLELPADKIAPLASTMAAQMGQSLFDPPNVKGWNGGREWISTSSLYDRYNFAGLITRDLSTETFQVQRPPMARAGDDDENSMSSGAVGGRVEGDEIIPAEEKKDDSMMTAEAPAMEPEARARAARRMRNSMAFRSLRLAFPFPAAKFTKAKGLSKPEEIVDRFAATFLAVDLAESSRKELVSYLNTNTFGEPAPFDIEKWDASRRLKGMFHLLFSTPEYQLN